jgi:hypothetical protein
MAHEHLISNQVNGFRIVYSLSHLLAVIFFAAHEAVPALPWSENRPD